MSKGSDLPPSAARPDPGLPEKAPRRPRTTTRSPAQFRDGRDFGPFTVEVKHFVRWTILLSTVWVIASAVFRWDMGPADVAWIAVGVALGQLYRWSTS